MPNFTLRWANRSNSTQDWAISNGDNFQLLPNQVRTVQITINNDHIYQIAVNTNNTFAAAALTYTAATQTWQLNSQTPNEWQLATGNNIVTVRCLLDNAPPVNLPGQQPAYFPKTDFASTGVNPTAVQSIVEELRSQATRLLGSALGSKPLEPFLVGALGNFPYYWQNPNNLEFNAKTYAWISSALKARSDAMLQASSQTLPPMIAEQQSALLNAWKNVYGSFPEGEGQPIDRVLRTISTHWADPPTTSQNLRTALNLNQILKATPASGQPILPVLASYLGALNQAVLAQPPGEPPTQLDQVFNSIYIDVFSNISYSLSAADQAQLNRARQNAVNQQAALLNAWKNTYGGFPEGKGQPIDRIIGVIANNWADPPTTLNKIQSAVNLNQLLNQTPASGQPILPLLANYLNALGSAISLENNATLNQAYLGRALTAAQTPTAENGGLQTDDGVFHPAYRISTQLADILNGLRATSNAISLKMSVSRFSESEFSVSVNGGAGFVVPILDLFTLSIGGEASYFSDQIATRSNQTEVEMTYTGVTLVNYGPVAYDLSNPNQYWYWTKPIVDAIRNGDSDVSGFKFSPQPQVDLSESGPFGYLTGVAIANYPSVRITVRSSEFASIEQTFQQTARVGLSFLGIPLGIQGSESTYSHDVSVDASNQSITITLNPPQELIAGNAVDSVGWVLGVQTEYPAA